MLHINIISCSHNITFDSWWVDCISALTDSRLWPLRLSVPVLDRHLPDLESGKLPWCPEPAVPVRPGLDPWHPALQQVRTVLVTVPLRLHFFRGACDWGQCGDVCLSAILFRKVFGVRSECRPLLFRTTNCVAFACSRDTSSPVQKYRK